MTDRPIIMSTESVKAILDGRKMQTRRVIKFQPEPNYVEEFKETWRGLCPYGQVGQRLWVRETLEKRNDGCAIYAADKEQVLTGGPGINEGVSWEWAKTKRPSIFMPRWASRITLEITEVRVERVKEISRDDVVAEGLPKDEFFYAQRFMNLWDSLNAKRGFGWDTNCWVFVIEFKKLD